MTINRQDKTNFKLSIDKLNEVRETASKDIAEISITIAFIKSDVF